MKKIIKQLATPVNLSLYGDVFRRVLILAAALLTFEVQAGEYGYYMEDAKQSCVWLYKLNNWDNPNEQARIYYCQLDSAITTKRLDVPGKVYCVDTNSNQRIYHDVIGIEHIDNWSTHTVYPVDFNSVKTFIMPDSLQYIDTGYYYVTDISSLRGWRGLETIKLGSSFRRFWNGRDSAYYSYEVTIGIAGSMLFSGCRNLTCFTVGSGNDELESYCGMLYSKASGKEGITILLLCPPGTFGGVTIKGDTKRVGHYAFHRCYGLSHVTFPNTLEEIGQNAFAWCTNLTTIVLSDRLRLIDNGAFQGCVKI